MVNTTLDEPSEQFVENVFPRNQTLAISIKALSLGFLLDLKAKLKCARLARNKIAHELAPRIDGCIDTKILGDKFFDSVEKIIFELAEGDLILSIGFDVFNGDDIPLDHFLNGYAKRTVDWVIDDINIFD